jgi:3-deoxy-D-manno-octulosonic-acid transferase
MFYLYSFLFTCSLLILSPLFLFKMFYQNKYKEGLLCRFGFFNKVIQTKLSKKSNKTIWLHAVSVGEFLAALSIINKIKKHFPEYNLVITTTTKTGYNIAKERLLNTADVLYSPLDLSFIVKRFIKLINPKILIIMETELWPNLIHTTHNNNIPIILLNARISDKSFNNYLKIKFFCKKILNLLNSINTQTQQDYERLTAIGAPENKLKIIGNIKFDITPQNIPDKNIILNNLNLLPENKIFIAGSTHSGEEELILESFKYLINNNIKTTLILAPRHPERIPKIENIIKNFNFTYILKSKIKKDKDNPYNNKNYQIILIDTIGELFSLYNIADIVFVGGSLIPHGGHNILEPAYFTKPIIFGKHMHNFKEISNLFLSNNAAIQVNTNNELKQTVLDLLTDNKKSNLIADNAKKLLLENQGAVDKSIAIIKHYI